MSAVSFSLPPTLILKAIDMQLVGYASLADRLALLTFPLKREARVMPTTRIHATGDVLAVPASLTPAQDDTLGHLLFALKHEGINLSLLAQIMPHAPAQALVAAFEATPSGIYIRKACFLWEAFNKATLATTRRARGNMVALQNSTVSNPHDQAAAFRHEQNHLGNGRGAAGVTYVPPQPAALS